MAIQVSIPSYLKILGVIYAYHHIATAPTAHMHKIMFAL